MFTVVIPPSTRRAAATAATATAATATATADTAKTQTQSTGTVVVSARMSQGYRCAQCGKVHQLNMRDTVRCVTCGYRIMYKLRNNALKNCYTAR